jgi:hypothetical protein
MSAKALIEKGYSYSHTLLYSLLLSHLFIYVIRLIFFSEISYRQL